MNFKSKLVQIAHSFGFDIKRYPLTPPRGTSQQDLDILKVVAGYTMTSTERQLALVSAVRYLSRRKIQGSFVECGVWRGGSSMAMAYALQQENESNRHIFLYDTFEGMTEPTKADGSSAYLEYRALKDQGKQWCSASLEDVQQNMAMTKYPQENVHFVRGLVEETIPKVLPDAPIALLRLDTDWYESTKHELDQLFPLLCDGGVLILDDYGHWQGARQAVDEYFANHGLHYLMNAIDDSGCVLLKH